MTPPGPRGLWQGTGLRHVPTELILAMLCGPAEPQLREGHVSCSPTSFLVLFCNTSTDPLSTKPIELSY